jgi:hypothetical protein
MSTTKKQGPISPDLAAFFAVMAWDGGKIEVVAGTNNAKNPEKIDLLIQNKRTKTKGTRRWVVSADLVKLAQIIGLRANQYGNVYIGVGTYNPVENKYQPGTTTYNRSSPRPRYCFILDDVTDLAALRIPPTLAMETSPGNYQVVYVCTMLLSPKQAEKLGVGAALLAGCDLSGSDAAQHQGKVYRAGGRPQGED